MINEASPTKKLEFIFNDKKEVIIGSNREILRKLVDFCYTNGYKFNEISKEDVLDKISKTTLTMSSFHKLPSGGYIGGFDNANAAYLSGTAKKYLSQIGEVSDIKFSDSDSTKITPFIDFPNDLTPVEVEFDLKEEKKYYLLGAYDANNPNLLKQYVEKGKWYNGFAVAGLNTLKDKVNEIPVGAMVAVKSSYTKERTKSVIMIKITGVVTKNYQDGTQIDVNWDKKFTPFEIIRPDVGGYRSTLHEVNNKEHIDLIWNSESKIQPAPDDIIKFEPYISSTGGLPNYTSISSKPVSSGDKYDFNLSSDIKNNLPALKGPFTDHITNPFRQAICVLGKSGMGKSTTIDKLLKSLNMEYDFIIPTSSTTNLLSQYSPSGNKYIDSRLGKLIMDAHKNPQTAYTAVFDECHKANVIEMINDELLQAISLYRNDKKRFISVDDDTASLYKGLTRKEGNLLIPDNLGFIFLSSKPNIIIDNADFFNRVDIYVLKARPPQDASITLNSEYFETIGNKKDGSKTPEDVDRIKELHN